MNKTIVTCVLSVVCLGAALADTTTIQYLDDFESYPLDTPLVDGINDWYASSTGAVVQGTSVKSGTQAAAIPVDVALSNRYEAVNSTNIWLQMDARAVRYDGTTFPVAQSNGSSQFYLNSDGYFVIYDGMSGWHVVTQDASGTPLDTVPDSSWMRLDLHLDYEAKVWGLNCNSTQICASVNFATSAGATFSGFELYNGGNSISYLDNVTIIDSDAMPHLSFQPPALTNTTAFGLQPPDKYLDIVCKGDGSLDYSITTNPAVSWMTIDSGTGSLTDFSTNRVTVSFNTNGLTPGRRTTSLWVVSTNWGGSTQEVPIVLDLGWLNVYPGGLTNTAMEGRNPVSQSFVVTNGGAGVFNYTVSPSAAWMGVTPPVGSVTPGAANTHTVNYAPSTLAPGEYPSLITVASTNQGGVTQLVEVAFSVVSQPVLSVVPANMYQLVEKGANPTGMSFKIWNSGLPPRVRMDYSITDDAWWILPCVNGSSSGETNIVGINFADMTTMPTGIYSSVITIIARDNGTGYTPTGEVVRTSFVDVVINIRSLPAPAWMSAGSGTDSDKVIVSWAAVPPFEGGKVYYDVWRGSTRDFDERFVARIVGGLETTSYNDTSADPGKIYYYWVQAVNEHDGTGALSDYDSGYRALGAPAGIWASIGNYHNKVHVHWSGVDGAQAYEVWRAVPAWTLVQTTPNLEFDDFDVAEGARYNYKIRAAKNGTTINPGDFSPVVTGCILSRPTNLSASQGDVVDRVRLAWSVAPGAVRYEIWRLSGATYKKTGVSTSLSYYDANVTPGTKYSYKLKSRNASGATEFTDPVTGYAAVSGVDIAVWQPVFLPRTLRAGASPRVLSLRVGNQGGTTLSGDNGTVAVKYYGSNHVSGATSCLASVTVRLSLPPGASQVLCVPAGNLRMPVQTSDYTVWVEVLPAWPSQLSDTNPLNNVAAVRGNVKVAAVSQAGYWGFNDFDGDGISDLVMDVDAAWYARTVDNRLLGWAVPFGSGFAPVRGMDFDGDNRAEPLVFGNGQWHAMLSASGYPAGSATLGHAGCIPVPGDYTGNGLGNMAVYSTLDGCWFILDDAFRPLVWGDVFGAADVVTVPGDYDGDGIWDMTMYHKPTGGWYSRGIDGALKIWGKDWGGPSWTPVMGDYNGDGAYDLAVYNESTGIWNIQTALGEEIARNYWWGGPGFTPVPGDYDGDGVWDLTVYDRNTGQWHSRSLSSGMILRGDLWGLPGYLPVGTQ